MQAKRSLKKGLIDKRGSGVYKKPGSMKATMKEEHFFLSFLVLETVSVLLAQMRHSTAVC